MSAERAEWYLEQANQQPSGEGQTFFIGAAQVEATLALVEEQRTANLIALGLAGDRRAHALAVERLGLIDG